MLDFTFLTTGQIFGYKVFDLFDLKFARHYYDKQLDVFKRYGTECAITDFSILLGGSVKNYHDNEGRVGENRAGWWWSSTYTISSNSKAHAIGSRAINDYAIGYNVFNCDVGGRPATNFSLIRHFCSKQKQLENGILEVEFGEYPQDIVNEELSDELEKAYLNGLIKQTGKSYTTNLELPHLKKNYIERNHIEYEYNGKKYIRVVSDSEIWLDEIVLSDGRKVESNSVYWISIEPIKWFLDKKTNILLSKKVLFAGIPYGEKVEGIEEKKYSLKNCFNYSLIKQFMDKYFSKDIIDNARLAYIDKIIDDIEDNNNIKKDLYLFVGENIKFELFDELNKSDKKRDSFISCMKVVFDSDTYHEMYSKLNLLKQASFEYEKGKKKEAFELIKEVDSDKHKEVINGQIVSYPRNSINKIEKPKMIIDRMKELYFRIDDSFDVDYIDSIHENSSSLKDLCNKINYYKRSKKDKRKVKSLFTK